MSGVILQIQIAYQSPSASLWSDPDSTHLCIILHNTTCPIPANTCSGPDADLIPGRRRRRRPGIKSASGPLQVGWCRRQSVCSSIPRIFVSHCITSLSGSRAMRTVSPPGKMFSFCLYQFKWLLIPRWGSGASGTSGSGSGRVGITDDSCRDAHFPDRHLVWRERGRRAHHNVCIFPGRVHEPDALWNQRVSSATL